MKKLLSKGQLAILIIFSVLIIDQVIKILVKTKMYWHESIRVTDWFYIYFTENNGMAFGMEIFGKLFLTTFRIVAVALIIYYLVKIIKKGYKTGYIVCMSMILAGAVGNIIDSVFYGVFFNESTTSTLATFMPEGGGYSTWFYGKVVDMFYFPIIDTTWPHWMPFVGGEHFIFFSPIFNFADASISCGIIALLLFYSKYMNESLHHSEHKSDKKMLNRFFIGGIIFSCLLLGGCKKGIPKDIIKPAKMEQLLYDYHMAKAMADELSYEEKYKQPLYINYVLEKHHTTQAEFDSSMVWYTRHTDELSKIYENINKRYKKEQETINHLIAIRDNKPKETQPGDSINVWYGNPLNMLTNYITSNKLKFDIPADTNFKQHDELVWKMRYTFLSNKHIPDTAVMAMYMRYENDSLIQVVKKVVRPRVDSLVLKSDSAYQMKELKGFIYYPGNDEKKVLLIDNVTLMRYHHPQTDSISVSKSDSIKDDNDLKQLEISVNNRHRSAAAKDIQKKDEIQLQQR